MRRQTEQKGGGVSRDSEQVGGRSRGGGGGGGGGYWLAVLPRTEAAVVPARCCRRGERAADLICWSLILVSGSVQHHTADLWGAGAAQRRSRETDGRRAAGGAAGGKSGSGRSLKHLERCNNFRSHLLFFFLFPPTDFLFSLLDLLLRMFLLGKKEVQ